jgi:hypothetical protein
MHYFTSKTSGVFVLSVVFVFVLGNKHFILFFFLSSLYKFCIKLFYSPQNKNSVYFVPRQMLMHVNTKGTVQ